MSVIVHDSNDNLIGTLAQRPRLDFARQDVQKVDRFADGRVRRVPRVAPLWSVRFRTRIATSEDEAIVFAMATRQDGVILIGAENVTTSVNYQAYQPGVTSAWAFEAGSRYLLRCSDDDLGLSSLASRNFGAGWDVQLRFIGVRL